jgi:hypothetical protein
MKDYTEIIGSALVSNQITAAIRNDVNSEIRRVLDDDMVFNQIHWFPPFLAEHGTNFYLFMPFPFDPFLGVDEAQKDCSSAQVLADSLKSKGITPKIFFIVDDIENVRFVQGLRLSSDFGLLHDDPVNPVLEFSIPNQSDSPHRILPYVLDYLSNPISIKDPFANVIKRFVTNYKKHLPTGDEEHEMIRRFISALLKCDTRFELPPDQLTFMASIERSLPNDTKDKLRDHYFHTCNTLLLGYIVIDKSYDRFSTISSTYGTDIIPEFIWAITALYHDIGYPACLLDKVFNHAYLEDEDEGQSNGLLKDKRQKLWDKKFQSFAHVINDLYDHITTTNGEVWLYDGFAYPKEATVFLGALKQCFVEKGAHGAHGTLLIINQINKVIRSIRNKRDRQFLYRHMAIAAISVLFHDGIVRNILREMNIQSIQVAKFPFSGLLTYVDILQEDRREFISTIEVPDVLSRIEYSEGVVEARLNPASLCAAVKLKLFTELSEALTFFIVNGLNFKIPAELV